jgi:K319-like protein
MTLSKFTSFSLGILFSGALAAQTANTPPTLQALNIERALDPASGVLTVATPTIPPVIAAGLLSGALELRESMNYNPTNQVLTINAFTVQTGAPIPTPPSPAVTAATFSIATMNVDKIYSALTPKPSLMLVGTVASNSPPSPYGTLAGAPASLSIGYTTDTPPKLNTVVLSISGEAVEFSAAAQGTLTFVQPATPPTQGNTPTIVISSPTSVYTRQADLDASNSTSSNMPLTFAWTVVNGTADIARGNTGKALAYLNGGFGSYTFKVTVTDAKGVASTQNVVINYY